MRAVRPFHSAMSHRHSRVTTALTELPTFSRAVGVDNTSRSCPPQPVEAREAAQPSQEGAARGPSGACRAAARRVGVIEGGPLARATVRVSGGYSLPDARCSRSRSRTCSPLSDSPGDGAVRPHGPPAFAEQPQGAHALRYPWWSGESDGCRVRTGCNKGMPVAGRAAAIHLLLLSTRLTYGPLCTGRSCQPRVRRRGARNKTVI